jgi:hypothetical protein
MHELASVSAAHCHFIALSAKFEQGISVANTVQRVAFDRGGGYLCGWTPYRAVLIFVITSRNKLLQRPNV